MRVGTAVGVVPASSPLVEPSRFASRTRGHAPRLDLSAMNKTSLPLLALMGLAWWSFTPTHSYAQQAPVPLQPLLKATRSWDGTPYRAYPRSRCSKSPCRPTRP